MPNEVSYGADTDRLCGRAPSTWSENCAKQPNVPCAAHARVPQPPREGAAGWLQRQQRGNSPGGTCEVCGVCGAGRGAGWSCELSGFLFQTGLAVPCRHVYCTYNPPLRRGRSHGGHCAVITRLWACNRVITVYMSAALALAVAAAVAVAVPTSTSRRRRVGAGRGGEDDVGTKRGGGEGVRESRGGVKATTACGDLEVSTRPQKAGPGPPQLGRRGSVCRLAARHWV